MYYSVDADLIETSWNVKLHQSNTNILFSVDLIETSWNVKLSTLFTMEHLTGFNRNIVECKGQHSKVEISSNFDLIETSWNVKNDEVQNDWDTFTI